MALTQTTLSSAVATTDTSIVVASATGFAANNVVRIDDENMLVAQSYVSGTTIPVIRGVDGSVGGAHVTSAKVLTGLASDFSSPGAGTETTYQIAGRARRIASYSASGAITLPTDGTDLIVELNGTSVLAMTVAAPTKDIEGSMMWIAANGVAAHTITFTGGLSGAGSNYDVVTVNSTAPILLGPVMAVNGLWQLAVAVPLAGTVTNITGTVA